MHKQPQGFGLRLVLQGWRPCKPGATSKKCPQTSSNSHFKIQLNPSLNGNKEIMKCKGHLAFTLFMFTQESSSLPPKFSFQVGKVRIHTVPGAGALRKISSEWRARCFSSLSIFLGPVRFSHETWPGHLGSGAGSANLHL